MPQLSFDRFHRYADLTAILHQFAAEYPTLIEVASIGKSHEGRDIWVVTATNTATGPAGEKPAFWVDGNIHSVEVSASAACLYLLNTLAEQYGKDADITRALDTRAFYIVPRINPDGAEWALADKPKYVRSSTRPYPYDEPAVEGMTVEDADGDGRILSMRIPDPNGLWKAHPDDARLMIRREPAEVGGTYFRVLPEGTYQNYDGYTLKVNRPQQGLDLNRNFPANWRQEFEQMGAGPYPTSEPEIRAVTEFIVGHNNICGGISFHTFSGVLLRPHAHLADDEFVPEDLWVYKTIGKKGTELTGYPNISVYHDFRYHPKQVITGDFDWLFEHRGAFVWTIEIWSPQREAGITDYHLIDWFRDHPEGDDLKLMQWNDGALQGKGFVDWYPFDHPQLGRVEIGGWNKMLAIHNPPGHLLEKELARFPKWLVWQALLSPRMELVHAGAEDLGNGTHRVRMVVQNTGWLPSYVSKEGLKRQVVRPVRAEIELPEGCALIAGKVRNELGQLEGRAYKHSGLSFWPDPEPTGDRALAEWVVRGKAGDRLGMTAAHERAGTVRAEIIL
ncbi:MAG: carboxypeptidase [Betaproteobacteria bacterium]|nr:carboxypeptidase [Betaproteobacteria bacterium]